MKLDQYYDKLADSPLFAAAVILHPGRSFRWLEARWHDDYQLAWLRQAKEGLKGYWETWYKNKPHIRDSVVQQVLASAVADGARAAGKDVMMITCVYSAILRVH